MNFFLTTWTLLISRPRMNKRFLTICFFLILIQFLQRLKNLSLQKRQHGSKNKFQNSLQYFFSEKPYFLKKKGNFLQLEEKQQNGDLHNFSSFLNQRRTHRIDTLEGCLGAEFDKAQTKSLQQSLKIK